MFELAYRGPYIREAIFGRAYIRNFTVLLSAGYGSCPLDPPVGSLFDVASPALQRTRIV